MEECNGITIIIIIGFLMAWSFHKDSEDTEEEDMTMRKPKRRAIQSIMKDTFKTKIAYTANYGWIIE